jgi:hypothetical protein
MQIVHLCSHRHSMRSLSLNVYHTMPRPPGHRVESTSGIASWSAPWCWLFFLVNRDVATLIRCFRGVLTTHWPYRRDIDGLMVSCHKLCSATIVNFAHTFSQISLGLGSLQGIDMQVGEYLILMVFILEHCRRSGRRYLILLVFIPRKLP